MKKNCFFDSDENAKKTALSTIASHELDGATYTAKQKEVAILYAQGKITEREYYELSGLPKEHYEKLIEKDGDKKLYD